MPMCSLLGCQSAGRAENFISSDDEWRYVIPNLMRNNEAWIAKYIKEAKQIGKIYQDEAKKYQRELLLFKELFTNKNEIKQSQILTHSFNFASYQQNITNQETNGYRRKMIRQNLDDRLTKLCQQIEIQLQNSEHPINALRKLFQSHFYNKYKEFLPQFEDQEIQSKKSGTQKFFKKIMSFREKKSVRSQKLETSIQEESKSQSLVESFISSSRQTIDGPLYQKAMNYIMGFIFLIRIIINKFYLALISKEDMIELQEDFLRLSVNLVVQSQIFAIILQFCRVDSYKLDKEMRDKYVLFEVKEPEKYKISPYLTLNSSSPLLEQMRLLFKAKEQKDIKVQIKGHGEQELDEKLKLGIQDILKEHNCGQEFSFQYMKMIREKLYRNPFYRSIKFAKAVFSSSKPPMKKLIELNFLKSQIKEDIVKFWISISPNPQEVLFKSFDRDEYLTIFIYILTKIQVPDLISQFKILDTFVSKYIRAAGDGCQISETFNMLEASIYWLIGLSNDQITSDGLENALGQIRENLNGQTVTPYEWNPKEDWDPFRITINDTVLVKEGPIEEQWALSTVFAPIVLVGQEEGPKLSKMKFQEKKNGSTQQLKYIHNFRKMCHGFQLSFSNLILRYFRDAEVVVDDTQQDAKKMQREFQLFLKTQHIRGSSNCHDSYLESINMPTDHPVLMEIVDQDYTHQYKMVQRDLTEDQCIIFMEIEHQVSQTNHPVSYYCMIFEEHFNRKYGRYIDDLKGGKIDGTHLFRQIAEENKILQANHILRIIDNESMDEEDKEAELLRKDQITVFQQAMQEVKDFTFVIRSVIFKFYVAFLKKNDCQALVEDMLKLSINKVMTYQVQKVLLCLCRVETFSEDKELRVKYDLLGKIAPEDFGIDPYLTLNSQSPIIDEISKNSAIMKQSSDVITEDRSANEVSKDYSSLIINQDKMMEEYFKEMDFLDMDESFKRKVTDDIKTKLQNKPYKECVIKFRQIMLENKSPMIKLFQLQDLKEQIKREIIKFWDGFGAKGREIVGSKFSRDEYISIFLFIICKAQVPDLISQLRLIVCFSSPYIQESNDGSFISETFNMVETCIKWIQGLQSSKLEEEGYLLKATIKIKDKLSSQGYQYVKELSESFDPFQVTQYGGSFGGGRNSYFIK